MTPYWWNETEAKGFCLSAVPVDGYAGAMKKMPNHPRLYRRDSTYCHRAAAPLEIKVPYPKIEEADINRVFLSGTPISEIVDYLIAETPNA